MANLVNAGEFNNKSNPDSSQSEIDSLLKKVELITIMINGEKDNRINIVIMNRWTSKEKESSNSLEMRDEILKAINESLISAPTLGNKDTQTANANYHEFFNMYGLWYPESPEWDKDKRENG